MYVERECWFMVDGSEVKLAIPTNQPTNLLGIKRS